LDYFLEMIRIDSESRNERAMADYLTNELTLLGGVVREDNAHKKSGGNAGNVIGWFAGDEKIEPLILNAHIDTVTPGKGIIPKITDGRITSDGMTILGSDDKSGIAMILAVLADRKKNMNTRVPLEVVFTVSEEIGLLGAKGLDVKLLHGKRGYSLDGNLMGEVVKASPSQINYGLTIMGKSVHAGVEPENGINAIKVAGDFLSGLDDGRIDEETTMNVGIIKGGKANNIVCDEVDITGEIRSHDKDKLAAKLAHVLSEAQRVKKAWNTEIKFIWHQSFKGLRFDENEELIKISSAAFKKNGISQKLIINGGGSDANALAEEGIKLAVIGTGMQKIHTINEFIDIADLEKGYKWLSSVLKVWEEQCQN